MMENGKDSAIFQGQVKACRGDKPPQWKSGFVTISQSEDGGLCAKMFLNVMPAHVYSQINISSTGMSVKSNRLVIEDSKGVGMYVRLNGSREVEESRKAITRLAVRETPKRNKSEVGVHPALSTPRTVHTQLKSPPPSEIISSPSTALSWTKISSPKVVTTKSGEAGSAILNGWPSASRPKRRSFEMEDGDLDQLYNDENHHGGRDRAMEYNRSRKVSPGDLEAINKLKANNFYGKNALTSPGLHVKSPRGRVREQGVSSASKGLYYTSMLPTAEPPVQSDEEENQMAVVPSAADTGAGNEVEGNSSNSSIIGFDNLGNTCFMNSPLQCLAYLEPLSLDIQTVVHKYGKWLKPVSVNRLLYLLMKDVRRNSAGSNPDRVKRILMKLRQTMDGKFAANTQQDAHELLSEILDRCHEEVQDLMKMEDDDNSDIERTRIKLPKTSGPSRYILSPTESNFSWFFKNSFQLQTCKNHTMTQEEHDTTMMLALTSQPELHLQDCLDNYFKGCEVDIKCEHCNQPEKATITRKVVRRPRCLILNLLRYCTDNMDAKKKMDKVTIPRFISIADFCTDDAKPPLYMPPTFLAERVMSQVQESDCSDFPSPVKETDNSTSSQHHSLHTDKNGVGYQQRMAQGVFNSSLIESNGQEVRKGAMGNENSESGAFGSFDQPTTDNDSVFEQMESTTEVTNSSSLSSLSLENVSVTCDLKEEEEKNVISDDEEDDNVVTFAKICPLNKSRHGERVKCRGGSVKDKMGNDSHLSVSLEEGEMKGVLDHCGELVNGEVVDDQDGFVAVGQVHTIRRRRVIEDSEDKALGVREPSNELPVVDEFPDFDPSLKRKNYKEHGNYIAEANSGQSSNFNQSSEREADSKEHNYTSMGDDDDDVLMDLEDMGTQLLCGKNVHEYSESELQSLDIESFTEYEMLLYAQALSRMEYAKENEARERRKKRCVEQDQSLENFSEDFVYDPSFLEETGSMYSGVKSVSSSTGNYSQMLEVSNSPAKIVSTTGGQWTRTEESLSDSLSTKVSSGHESLSESDFSGNAGNNCKVPDILELNEGMDISLFCDENLNDDVKMKTSKASSISQLDSFSSVPASSRNIVDIDKCLFCGQALVGCQCVHCSMGAGDFDFLPDDNGISRDGGKPIQQQSDIDNRNKLVTSGVLSDKNQSKQTITQTDLIKAMDISSKTVQKEKCPKPPTNTNSLSCEKKKHMLPTPSPTSQSPYFQKPTLDLCIVSPSKNRNLVKTRDYSRLRSPSASPKKKSTKSSPLKKGSASKQLRFADDVKMEKLSKTNVTSSNNHISYNLPITPQKPTNADFRNATPTVTNGNTSNFFDKLEVKTSSRALDFGEDEPDAMNNHGNISSKSRFSSFQEDGSSLPTVPLFSTSFTNTSTPIASNTTGVCQSATVQNLSSTDLETKSTATPKTHDDLTEADNGTSAVPKDGANYGACAPFQDGSYRRKANRSLASSFSAAEGKENSVQLSQERQARRKRISHIEQGEADCCYRLVGIVNHHGESLFAGHYTCSSYNLEKQRWYLMDDKHTRETTESFVRKDSSATGYVFFYMDKDLFESYANVRKRMPSSRKSSSTT